MCFGQWGILKVSEFGGFVLRSVIFFEDSNSTHFGLRDMVELPFTVADSSNKNITIDKQK